MLKVAAFVSVLLALTTSALYFAISGSSDTESNNRTPVQGGNITTLATQPLQSPESTEAPEETPSSQLIRLTALGDMIPHDTVTERAKTADGYDFTKYFSSIQPLIAGDIIYCSQEAPISQNTPTGFPVFRAPAAFAEGLSGVGCNLISIANDHIADDGESGISQTLDTWGTLDSWAVTGANRTQEEQNAISYFDVSGKKFAFVAFSESSKIAPTQTYSVNIFSDQLVDSLVGEAKTNADFVIVAAHWGEEDNQNVTESQRNWAQRSSEAGADLILGSGPHLIQPIETITNSTGEQTTVLFSLGNFLNTQLNIEQLTSGIAYIDIPAAKENNDIQISFVPTYMHYTWTQDQKNNSDFLARDNLGLYELSSAQAKLDESLFTTTAQEQIDRITSVLTQNGAPVTIL